MKIAIIEDDSTISFAVSTFLKRYDMEVAILDSLAVAEEIDLKDFNLIILDVNLPDGSGFEYLKWLREFSSIPVIMLTVKNADEYVLKGFENGADEYITKPFSLPVLKARIDNIFRRKDMNNNEILFHELSLNLTSMTVKLNNENLELNRQEFAVLELLLENKNINLIREKIIDSVWGYNLYEVNDNTLTVTIKRLRNKLKDYGKYIKTVRGLGYMWEDSSDERK
ncbi:response regulator transcription factor [Streptococcus equi]|uniref:response regulator transcription factor n=1 Tax=Streptococcus equi TaxID=1336 RepID=UPI0012AF6645|nr:response regulator transcription factor [Streptococcus equi]MCD3431274.1 response regulator transcription factor [Streptococcus equi subsp. zooepidemicus]QGM23243.1 response regulator [Streptococcus equi subsp. zooepidemicus]HEL0800045.1 response regulator transcription factor [Streptococcus equi subsp. zooepidemicus]